MMENEGMNQKMDESKEGKCWIEGMCVCVKEKDESTVNERMRVSVRYKWIKTMRMSEKNVNTIIKLNLYIINY